MPRLIVAITNKELRFIEAAPWGRVGNIMILLAKGVDREMKDRGKTQSRWWGLYRGDI